MHGGKLVREPITKHPWRFHKWHDVDGMAGLFGMVSQCQRCNMVKVFNPLIMTEWIGSHEMLVDND